MRRPGPVTEEYWGCRRECWNLGKHTEEDGCERYTPPCQHPVESIGYDSEGEGRRIECQDCQMSLSVQLLAEQARVALSIGCTCEGCLSHPAGECDGHCGAGRVTAWTLDPVKVLRILELESHL